MSYERLQTFLVLEALGNDKTFVGIAVTKNFALCHLLVGFAVKKDHFQDMINIFLESLVCINIMKVV